MAVASSVQSNAEDHKIPNASLTVGIMTYRRNTVLEIEFIHNVCYNYIDTIPSFISAVSAGRKPPFRAGRKQPISAGRK